MTETPAIIIIAVSWFALGYVANEVIKTQFPSRGHVDVILSAADKDGNKTLTLRLGAESLGYVTLNKGQLDKLSEVMKSDGNH